MIWGFVADQGLYVVARREVLPVPGQNHDMDVVVLVSHVQEMIDSVDQCSVLGIGHVRSIHGDGGHVPGDIVENCFTAHSLFLPLFCSEPERLLRGRPKTRSPMTLR